MQATQAAPAEVRTFIQEYFDAWKGTDEKKILAYYSDDVVIDLPTAHSKGSMPCEITLYVRSSLRSPAMYMRF
jgi:ketosteroid isomerase-like protein